MSDAPAVRFTAPATAVEPLKPSHGTSRKPVSIDPSTAPSVLKV